MIGTKVVIEAHDLSRSYRAGEIEVLALRGVTFTIYQSDFVAIVGPSGSGKSTTMNILGCLDPPSGGSYHLDGAEVSGLSKNELAGIRNRKIGFVFQEHQLLGGLTALDNVVVPAIAAGRVTPGIETRARELLDRVGLGSRLGHLPAELSGGERQRVAVARALLLEPRLVLADEPTGQLDARTAATVTDLLVELASESGRMLVVVTHADAVARRIGAVRQLSDGRLLP